MKDCTDERKNAISYSEDIIGKHSGIDPDLYPNVDWYDVLFNKFANNDRLTLNVNGGSESATYYLSAGYYGRDWFV